MKITPLKKIGGKYIGLTDTLLHALPSTAPELELKYQLPRRRAATILERLAKQGERVVILGAVIVQPSGRYAKLYGRPEHHAAKPKKRGGR